VNPRTFLVLTFLISALALVAHAQTVSPDGSSITPSSGGSLVTTDGTWTFGTATVAWGTAVLLNGQQLPNAYGTELLVSGGKMYIEVGGSNPGWWVYQNGVSTQTADPTQGSDSPSFANPCTNYYTSSVATPSGYGAAYDLFSSQHELEVSVQNCPANSVTLTVGSNQSNQYIYNKGYLYQSSAWQPITLTSSSVLISSAWYTGSAQATLSVDPASWTYIVGYVCAWNGQIWQCGCATTSCTTSYWQLQAFQSSQASAGSGGTDNRVACNFWVAASGGSDSNPGTSAQPFATLGKLQSALQAQPSGQKVGCLKAEVDPGFGTDRLVGARAVPSC
jgi:hypothetical protein